MIRKLKKGFTLVELVVVIAVVAILAAVSVVSYVGITKKAKESNDKMVIDQFNTVLTNTLTLNKKGSVHELLEDLKEDAGFDIRTFAPELQGTSFVYYNKENHESFAYWDKTKQEVTYPKDLEGTKKSTDLWFFDDAVVNGESVTFDDGASHYLKSLSGAEVVNVKNGGGLDVGKQSVTEINIVNEGSKASGHIVARTNGGTLTVNAPLDTLDHYGDGEVLDITAIAGASYHEYGNFPKASIGQGRIVVEESGNIPSVEVTSTEPVTIETGKDITVNVSAENADNVSVNITNSSANVALDEKIDDSEVAGNKVTIKKVMTFAELKAAIAANEEYILLGDDITDHNEFLNINYSVVIDGDNHEVSGNGGIRTGSTYTLFAANAVNARSGIEVEFRNITAINTKTSGIGRVLETRAGGMKSFTIKNSHIESKARSNDGNPLVLGSSSTQKLDVLIENSELVCTTTGYAMMIWVPVNMEIVDSTLSGYAGLYFKAGSAGSNTTVRSSTITAPSVHSGDSDNFGAVVFEDGNMTMDIVDTIIDVTGPGKATQTAILFNYPWAYYYGIDLENIPVKIYGSKTFINGEINAEYLEYGNDPTYFVEISGGRYSWNPSDYLATGYSCRMVDGLYLVD